MIVSKMLFYRWVWFGLGFLCCWPSAIDGKEATAKGEKKKLNPAYLSLIALGAVPERRFGVPDDDAGDAGGKRSVESVLLPPAEGSVPPSVLYWEKKTLDLEGEKSEEIEWMKVRVGFNRSAAMGKLDANEAITLHLRYRGRTPEYERYVKIPPLVPGSQTLCFLSQSRDEKRPWTAKPKVSLLNLQSKALIDKNLLIRNFSDHPVMVSIGKRRPEILASGKRKSYRLDPDAAYCQVMAKLSKQRSPLLKTSIRVPDRALTLFVFYNTHTKAPAGKSVGVFRTTVKRVGRRR